MCVCALFAHVCVSLRVCWTKCACVQVDVCVCLCVCVCARSRGSVGDSSLLQFNLKIMTLLVGMIESGNGLVVVVVVSLCECVVV